MRVWVRSVRRKGGRYGGAITSTTRLSAKPSRRHHTDAPMPSSGPPEQPGRADGEDGGHGREEGEVRELREEGLAEVVEEADEQGADQGALQAAHAAHDDD